MYFAHLTFEHLTIFSTYSVSNYSFFMQLVKHIYLHAYVLLQNHKYKFSHSHLVLAQGNNLEPTTAVNFQ